MTEYTVLNLGAGKQSTVLAMTEKYDVAIFADTQEEPQWVYRNLDWIKANAKQRIETRTAGRLGEDLKDGRNSTGQSFASIPAFTSNAGGRRGMTQRQCTQEYKVKVIDRFIRREVLGLKPRQRVPKGVSVRQIYGISWEESGRAMRIRERLKETRWIQPIFPLIDRFWTRLDCDDWAEKNVPHPIHKSSCVFCPYRSDAQWKELIQLEPASFARAVEIDRALRIPGNIVNRNLHEQLFLHSSLRPLDQVDFPDRPGQPRQYQLGFAIECAGMCGT
jgi:hypothetical protein